MKTVFFTAMILVASTAFAQKAAIKDIPVDGEGSTTISITKGGSAERDYDILSSSAEISGDSNVLLKGAKESWKTACADWKKEIKELNKENSVLALNCNSPKCLKEDNGTTCVSTGSYQLKVKIKK